jgi:heme oxygenase
MSEPSSPLQSVLDHKSTREALRSRTARTHDRLHELPAFDALRRGELTLTAYGRLLARLAGLHGALEDSLGAHGQDPCFGWWSPGRAALLQADLEALGVGSPGPGAAVESPRRHLPALDDVDSALGACGVVEGSAIGGAVIGRWLSDGLGIGPANGGAFFCGAPGQASRWRACCEVIERRGGDPERRDLMLASAERTFEVCADWLEEAR